jgi:hypothetical protein
MCCTNSIPVLFILKKSTCSTKRNRKIQGYFRAFKIDGVPSLSINNQCNLERYLEEACSKVMWHNVSILQLIAVFVLIYFEISRFVYVHFPCMHLKALVLIWNPCQPVPAWDRFDFCVLVAWLRFFLISCTTYLFLKFCASCQAQFRSTLLRHIWL